MKISLPTLLFVVFLVLKLCGVIAWSWWWVTAPLWIVAALWLLFLFLAIAFAVLAVAMGIDSKVRTRLDSVNNHLRSITR